jgi:hypothetical protein
LSPGNQGWGIKLESSLRVKKEGNFMKKAILSTGLAVAFGLTMSAAAASEAARQGPLTIRTGGVWAAKVASPAPPANVKKRSQKTSIGKGKAFVKLPAPSLYWTEDVDLHMDGLAESTDFLYDASQGVLYAYSQDTFVCANGDPEQAGILLAGYTAGNKANLPVGSGFYIVGVKGGRCGGMKEGGYGCKVDATGLLTECGRVAVDAATGQATVSPADKD